jgi:hypothetical protein
MGSLCRSVRQMALSVCQHLLLYSFFSFKSPSLLYKASATSPPAVYINSYWTTVVRSNKPMPITLSAQMTRVTCGSLRQMALSVCRYYTPSSPPSPKVYCTKLRQPVRPIQTNPCWTTVTCSNLPMSITLST